MTSFFGLKLSYQRKGGQFFMKENPIIVLDTLSDIEVKSHSLSMINKDIPVSHFKIKDANVTFYNGVDKISYMRF